MPPPVRLGKLGRNDLETALQMACEEFFRSIGASEDFVRGSLIEVDPGLSLALRQDDRIVGVYLVAPMPFIGNSTTFTHLASLPALEGQALLIRPEFRGQGFGRLLRAALPALGRRQQCDYVWGIALKALDNSADWRKRRAVLSNMPDAIITAEPLTAELKSSLAAYADPATVKRWTMAETPIGITLSGRLLLETMPNDSVVPWVIADNRAACLPRSFHSHGYFDLEGQQVTVSGLINGETFAYLRSIVPANDLAADDEGFPSPTL